ncbi:MAG: hypothetical protein H6978_16015 [Gammaproteobacteria bacterium]|nr:hypothetical protein [Gammaproteobacteria bacterium]
MRFTIRHRLLLMSAALLALPVVGVQYLRETERFLQSNLASSLSGLTSAVAYSLRNSPNPFAGNTLSRAEPRQGSLFVYPLGHEIQLDGYSSDWVNYLDWAGRYGPAPVAGTAVDIGYKFLLGRLNDQLYGLLEIEDDDVTYQQSAAEWPVRADTVELIYADATGHLQRLYFSTSAQGAVTAYQIIEHWDYSTSRRPVTFVQAQWQETELGYNLEFQAPAWLFAERLGVVVHDIDGGSGRDQPIGTAGPDTALDPGPLIRTSLELEEAVARLSLNRGQRVWLLDRHGQVLASGGSLDRPAGTDRLNFLFALLLPGASENFVDDLAGASRLYGEEVNGALAGSPGVRWRSSPDQRAVIVSAAHPVTIDGAVVGAVVIEETTGRIQTVQRRAMANLVTVSLLTYVAVAGLFIAVASRIAWRLTRLARDADAAIDRHGRVVAMPSPITASDEIGDVARHLRAMLLRLAEYHRYLESLAGKLVHELRTPIAIVRSSLDNLLEAESAATSNGALRRASEGTARLSELVMRLSEATRLEQAIQSAELQWVNLGAFVIDAAQGYEAAYPQRAFTCDVPDAPVRVHAAPELIAQLLDKLVNNAVGFATSATAIEIRVAREGETASLSVLNRGPLLPAAMTGQLFDSMVSIRTTREAGEVHLGLGLYIVRLIMEYHHGSVSATNLADGSGVCFCAVFPSPSAQ